MPGAHLGQYEILSPIGAGGMGEVYRARDPKLGREVAIKVAQGGGLRDPDRPRPGRRARSWHRPPRPQAGQRVHHRRWTRQDSRLRHCQVDGRGSRRRRSHDDGADRGGDAARHGRLHGARAAAWSAGRCTGRRLQLRRRALRDGRRPARVSEGFERRHDVGRLARRSARALRDGPSDSPTLTRIVHRALEKQPQQRFQSARDVAFALEDLSSASAQHAAPADAPRPSRAWLTAVAAAVLLLAIGVPAAVARGWFRPVATQPVFQP